jgi:hypothetical protein
VGGSDRQHQEAGANGGSESGWLGQADHEAM